LERLAEDLDHLQNAHQFLSGNTSELLSKLQTHLDLSQFENRSGPSNVEYVAANDHQKRDHYLKYLKPDILVLYRLIT
jgi:hypothetical protein